MKASKIFHKNQPRIKVEFSYNQEYISKLRQIADAPLGHESSKTTEIYTHITTKGFDKIQSPLDRLNI